MPVVTPCGGWVDFVLLFVVRPPKVVERSGVVRRWWPKPDLKPAGSAGRIVSEDELTSGSVLAEKFVAA